MAVCTVVYRYSGQYWLVRYLNHISQDIPSSQYFEAILNGLEIARWGDD